MTNHPIPPTCLTSCYFCNKTFCIYFRPVSYSGVRKYCILLLPIGKITMDRDINLIWQDKVLLQEIYDSKTENRYHVENFVLYWPVGNERTL